MKETSSTTSSNDSTLETLATFQKKRLSRKNSQTQSTKGKKRKAKLGYKKLSLPEIIDKLNYDTLPDDPITRFRLFRADPWAFLRFCVRTRDQVDAKNPIKLAPTDRDYLKTLVRIWQGEPLFVVYKSRRMWISWLFISLYLWDAALHRHRDIFFVSKKEDDADELVKRARFIYESIPEDMIPRELLPHHHYKQNHLIFPETNSSIRAVAQGADQLRAHTASGIFMDEFAFWEKDKDTYTASKPTIEGGGKVTIVSTPPPQYGTEPSFFWNLCYDKI